VKRPILGLLAAATLSLTAVGTAPARAAAPPSSPQAVAATPAHDDDHHGHGDSPGHRHHYRPGHDSDDHGGGDGDRGRRRRCAGLIVVCLG
jgi:hypothetical protein